MSNASRAAAPAHAGALPQYRADIDGLRAVAVLGVLAYHFGLGVPGGYGGVDVFFVISGFLIAGIIKAELEAETFSLANFYVRRIRRILPALAVCLAVTTVAASVILFPFDFRSYGQSLTAVSIATSNIFFAHKTGNYFDASATASPLLHTWSLSIEEQFYLVFPLAAMLLFRAKRALILPVMMVVASLSLAYSIHAVARMPGMAFFSTPGRVWELLFGTILAFAAFSSVRNRVVREVEAFAGIGLIAGCYFAYSATTPFPGLAAVPLCLGAVLSLHSGMEGSRGRAPEATIVARLLSARPAVAIGKISYSVYLWHWPLLVLVQYRFESVMDGADTHTALELRLLLAAISIGLGAVSWRFIEQPFRKRAAAEGPWPTFAAGMATFAAVIGCSQLVSLRTNWLQGWSPEIAELAKAERRPDRPSAFGPRAPVDQGWPADSYFVGPGSGNVDTLVWGDSHAMAILPGLRDYLERTGQRIVVAAHSGCPPLINVSFHGNHFEDRCKPANDKVFAAMSNPAIKRVVMVSRWMLYASSLHYDDSGRAIYEWGGDASAASDFAPILKATVKALVDRGKTVVIVGPVPEQPFDVMRRTVRHIAWGDPMPTEPTLEHFLDQEKLVLAPLAELARSNNVDVVYPHLLLCDDRTCHYQKAGQPLYLDNNHLTAVGAKELGTLYAAVFSFGGGAAERHASK